MDFPYVEVDKTNREIMALLRDDARMPYGLIAKAVALSETAVRKRVAQMLHGKVFRFTIITNTHTLGFVDANLDVHASGDRLSEVATRIAEISDVDWCAICTGTYNIRAGLVCAGATGVYKVLEQIQALPGVREVSVSINLEVTKYSMTW
jgi:Lrp/AsnC family transcriptional regulator for asnA, asnC and gidA